MKVGGTKVHGGCVRKANVYGGGWKKKRSEDGEPEKTKEGNKEPTSTQTKKKEKEKELSTSRGCKTTWVMWLGWSKK